MINYRSSYMYYVVQVINYYVIDKSFNNNYKSRLKFLGLLKISPIRYQV